MHSVVQMFFLMVCIFVNVANAADKSLVQKPLILAVHPYLPYDQIVSRFTPLAELIGKAIGQAVEVRVGRDYSEHIKAIGTNSVDIAYLGPASYVKLVDMYGNKPLLARQELAGQPFLKGEIIVRRDSSIRTLADLKDKAFAFGDPDSTMGSIVPQRMLENAGVPLKSLNAYKYFVGHENVALAVLAGDYEAGAVKDEVFQHFAAYGLRALAETPLLADHVFVASTELAKPLVSKLRNLLLALNDSAAGKAAIDSIHPHLFRLAPAADSDYDNLRAIMKTKVPSGRP